MKDVPIAAPVDKREPMAIQPPEYSDDALAMTFAERHGDDLRFISPWGKWLIWDGSRWRQDDSLQTLNLARVVCREAAQRCSDNSAKKIASKQTRAAVEALALFLFEKPGPMTVNSGFGKRAGSGFISRNNDDPTAEATYKFMRAAGIPRDQTVIWNVIPWWNGTRNVTGTELREGVRCVRELICLLPKLRAVVLVGKKAAKAHAQLSNTGLVLTSSDHPSPLVRARYLERWRSIPSDWAKIRPVLGHQ
jgi:hypothetical protein